MGYFYGNIVGRPDSHGPVNIIIRFVRVSRGRFTAERVRSDAAFMEPFWVFAGLTTGSGSVARGRRV